MDRSMRDLGDVSPRSFFFPPSAEGISRQIRYGPPSFRSPPDHDHFSRFCTRNVAFLEDGVSSSAAGVIRSEVSAARRITSIFFEIFKIFS
jgi:hypothetical protein